MTTVFIKMNLSRKNIKYETSINVQSTVSTIDDDKANTLIL